MKLNLIRKVFAREQIGLHSLTMIISLTMQLLSAPCFFIYWEGFLFMSEKFKGIWIPGKVWSDENLSIMEKLFLVEINSLDNDEGCYASNKYFAKFFGITNQRASQIINSLIKKKIVSAKYERNGKEIKKRVLNIFDTYKEYFIRVSNKIDKNIKKIKQGYQENVKENNTYNNNTINNIYSHWNKKNIVIHKELTEDIKKVIQSTLKKYSEEEIIMAITKYDMVIKDIKYYFNHRWTLKNFLKQKNAFPDFLEGGVKLEAYRRDNGKSKFIGKDFDPERSYAQAEADGFTTSRTIEKNRDKE